MRALFFMDSKKRLPINESFLVNIIMFLYFDVFDYSSFKTKRKTKLNYLKLNHFGAEMTKFSNLFGTNLSPCKNLLYTYGPTYGIFGSNINQKFFTQSKVYTYCIIALKFKTLVGNTTRN